MLFYSFFLHGALAVDVIALRASLCILIMGTVFPTVGQPKDTFLKVTF